MEIFIFYAKFPFIFPSKKLNFYSILIKKQKYIPIARKMSLTFIDDFADVSMKSRPLSSAYACASSYSTTLLAAISALLPANAITIVGDA
jgi:Mg2+/citrate symporter